MCSSLPEIGRGLTMIHTRNKTTPRQGLADYFRAHQHQRGIIVCPDRKFIYMKSAKTAGSSILRGLLEEQIDGIIHQKDHPQEFDAWLEGIDDQALEEYFIYSVVRNPWDRAVSISRYFDMSLADFLKNFRRLTRKEPIRSHALPQSIYTHKDTGIFVDMICRVESLQSDMNLVFDEIGLPRQRLPFLNVSNRRHYSEFYTDQDVDRVATLYADDIRNYGYMFQQSQKEQTGR
jgi:hypothetical protein